MQQQLQHYIKGYMGDKTLIILFAQQSKNCVRIFVTAAYFFLQYKYPDRQTEERTITFRQGFGKIAIMGNFLQIVGIKGGGGFRTMTTF